jgi:hypothetical protein
VLPNILTSDGSCPSPPATVRLRAATVFFLPLLLLAPACDDPSPIFGGWPPPGGGDGTPGSLGAEAFIPDNGEWILPGAPVLEEILPSGTGVHTGTPIVMRFSESIASETLNGSFLVAPAKGGFPTIATVSRVGDGRLVVLLPQATLDSGVTYSVRVADGSTITDMTGESFGQTGELVQFTTAESDPATPSVLMTFPPTASLGQSAIGEITTIFDRAMNESSFTDTSFSITVDGVAPTFDPAPAPLDISGGLFPTADTRVWRWISLNGSGERESLGNSALVEVALSTGGASLLDSTGGVLPTVLVSFTTAVVAPPIGASITSAPTDAIGIANLTVGSGAELAIQVDFTGGLAGDEIGLFLFGTDTGESGNTVALAREVTLAADGDLATFALADLDMVMSASPLVARFLDGTVAFAFQLRRGSLVTPVISLDVDSDASGIQDPVLDTVAPELLSLDLEGALGASLYSELRGLSISGRASEEIWAAEVVTILGDNLAATAVLGARADGSFLTSPVALGVLDPASLPLAYTLTIFDSALNPQEIPKVGLFEQRGVVGPVVLGVGADIEVEVYDAETLWPIEAARVFTHGDDGAAYPAVANGVTSLAGTLAIASSAAAPTILTVEAAGYDIFSVVGVQATRLSIPLQRSVAGAATVSGSLTSASALAALTLPSQTLRYGDPRRVFSSEALFAGGACTSNPFGGGALDCPIGPELIRSSKPGAFSLLGGNFLLPEVSFTAVTALQTFHLELPMAGAADAEDQSVALAVSLLAEPGSDPLALPVEVASPVLNAAAVSTVDLANLSSDFAIAGEPRVQIEALVDGIPGAVPIGMGVSFDQGGDKWNVRTAVPGAVLPGGEYAGVVDTDLFVRGEISDINGLISVRRPRLSALPGLLVPNQMNLLDVSLVTSPAAAASTGGADFTIVFDNSIPDVITLPGLYRVSVVDGTGRTWTLYLEDPANGVVTDVHLPNIGAGGGVPLSSGSLTATVEAFSWPGFSLGSFLWSDLERSYDSYTKGPAVTFTQP